MRDVSVRLANASMMMTTTTTTTTTRRVAAPPAVVIGRRNSSRPVRPTRVVGANAASMDIGRRADSTRNLRKRIGRVNDDDDDDANGGASADEPTTETTTKEYALADDGALRVDATTTTTKGGKQTVVEVALTLLSGPAREAVKDATTPVELHWGARAIDGDGSWMLAPGSIEASGGKRDFGDGIATRSAFDSVGRLTLRVDGSMGDVESIASIVGIVVAGDYWAHSMSGDVEVVINDRCGEEGRGGASGAEALARRVADLEGGQVNLFSRFRAVDENLDAALDAGAEGAALVYAWLRLSSIKQLHWYAGNNYQGKDMASTQERLAGRIAHKATTSEDPTSRALMRASLAFLPRGGGNGDDIRMGILNIMRQHGIREGHRPGIEDAFIEQWHQKLHSNTTPDDVKICEAYLHFLHTGNWDDFWAHLWDNARLTRDDLAGMKAGWRSNGITGPALHMPHMIDSFKHYLWILKTTHGGGDVDSAMNFARYALPEDLTWEIDDLLNNRDAWWVPGKIVEIRKRLLPVWKHDSPNRDVVMLDATLEKFFRTKVEAVNHGDMSADDLLSLLELALTNVALTDESPRIAAALRFVQAAMSDAHGERWSTHWSQAMDAGLDFCALAMERDMDFLCASTQAAANVIASSSTKADPKYLMNFGEENVRSHSLFVVSQLISMLRPVVRKSAGRSPWQIVSVGNAGLEAFAGVAVEQTLSEIQGEDFTATPTVCLTETLGGLEDIPSGITAVITKSPVDLLSHIAIRARNTNVLLASVADDALWNQVLATAGETVRCVIVGETVNLERATVSGEASRASSAAAKEATKVRIDPYEPSTEWIVAPSDYRSSVVGGKSNSLAEMGRELNAMGLENVVVPGSFAIPFGTFERALEEDEETRRALAAAVESISAATTAEERRSALATARSIVRDELVCPRELEASLSKVIADISPTADIAKLWDAVCAVWASKWTERAWLSRKSCGIPDEDLNVAVLLMELVAAEFAFVLHTANPVTGDSDEIFGELCVGLGETLVGNDAGSALGFTVKKSTGEIIVRSLPSKLCGHFAPGEGTVIARSDSNGEDLEDFAGAGLYDSVTAEPTTECVVDYTACPLLWDAAARDALVRRIADVAKAIESYKGKPQDIEGAVVGDQIVLLQTRTQIC